MNFVFKNREYGLSDWRIKCNGISSKDIPKNIHIGDEICVYRKCVLLDHDNSNEYVSGFYSNNYIGFSKDVGYDNFVAYSANGGINDVLDSAVFEPIIDIYRKSYGDLPIEYKDIEKHKTQLDNLLLKIDKIKIFI